MGEMHALKIAKIVEMAERAKAPLIAMWDGGGSVLKTALMPWQVQVRCSTDWFSAAVESR